MPDCPARRSSPTPARPATWTSAARCIAFPPAPVSLARSRLLSISGKSRLLDEPLRRAADARDETVREFVTRRLGEEAADRLVEPFVSGIFAGDAVASLGFRRVPTPGPLGARARKPLPRSGLGDPGRPLRAPASAGTPLLPRRPRVTSARPLRLARADAPPPRPPSKRSSRAATAAGAFSREASGSRPTGSFSPRPRSGRASRLRLRGRGRGRARRDSAPAPRRSSPLLARIGAAAPPRRFRPPRLRLSRSPDPRRRLELEPLCRPRPRTRVLLTVFLGGRRIRTPLP